MGFISKSYAVAGLYDVQIVTVASFDLHVNLI